MINKVYISKTNDTIKNENKIVSAEEKEKTVSELKNKGEVIINLQTQIDELNAKLESCSADLNVQKDSTQKLNNLNVKLKIAKKDYEKTLGSPAVSSKDVNSTFQSYFDGQNSALAKNNTEILQIQNAIKELKTKDTSKDPALKAKIEGFINVYNIKLQEYKAQSDQIQNNIASLKKTGTANETKNDVQDNVKEYLESYKEKNELLKQYAEVKDSKNMNDDDKKIISSYIEKRQKSESFLEEIKKQLTSSTVNKNELRELFGDDYENLKNNYEAYKSQFSDISGQITKLEKQIKAQGNNDSDLLAKKEILINEQSKYKELFQELAPLINMIE